MASELSQRLIDLVLEGFAFEDEIFEGHAASVRARYRERYESFFGGLPTTNSGALWAYPLAQALSRGPGSREKAVVIGAMTECFFQLDDSAPAFRTSVLAEMWKYKYSRLADHDLVHGLVADLAGFHPETQDCFVDYTIEWLCFDQLLRRRQDPSGHVPVVLRVADAGVHGWFMLLVDSFTGKSWSQVAGKDPLLHRFCFDWCVIGAYWNDVFSEADRGSDATVSLSAPALADDRTVTNAFTNTLRLLESDSVHQDLLLMLVRTVLVLYCDRNSRYLARGSEVSDNLLRLAT
ncbi:hypothetical protein [Streptomyces sp. NPDC002156]